MIYLGKTEEDVFRRGMKYDVGYIDTSGKIVIAPRFSFASDFSEGLAHVTANDFDGFIDLRGRRVTKLANKSARDFHEGLAAITIAEGREYGFIDRTGKVVIQGRYRFVDDFSEGLAGVVIDYKYGFINRAGGIGGASSIRDDGGTTSSEPAGKLGPVSRGPGVRQSGKFVGIHQQSGRVRNSAAVRGPT